MLNKMRLFCVLILLAMIIGCASDASQSAGINQRTLATASVIRTFKDITVYPKKHVVEIKAWICLDASWLEQIACSPNSREHESLVVIKAIPSEIHAALLLAGFQSGSPGLWYYKDGELKFKQPTGEDLTIEARYTNSQGKKIQEPVSEWIRDSVNQSKFPDMPWVFGGSEFRKNTESMGLGEHYVADFTGSIIGLVTFGDEVLGFKRVFSDQEIVHAPQWKVNTDRIPAPDTEVTLIIRKAKASK